MLIFGHDYIDYDAFAVVDDISDIALTKPNQTLLIKSVDVDIQTVKYCKSNNIRYAILCQNIKDALFANALNASYIITNKSNSKIIQDIATEYMFDAKILAFITSTEEIEDLAKLGIDGVIFEKAIKG